MRERFRPKLARGAEQHLGQGGVGLDSSNQTNDRINVDAID
jgi:hypothetical protein